MTLNNLFKCAAPKFVLAAASLLFAANITVAPAQAVASTPAPALPAPAPAMFVKSRLALMEEWLEGASGRELPPAEAGALVLALTVGLFGIHQTWDFTLVPQTVIIESIGIVILGITTAMVMRPQPVPGMRRHATGV